MSELRHLLHPAADLDAAVAFYRDALGLSVTFRDGDRFVALDAGGTVLALVSGTEDIVKGRAAGSFRVADVATSVERVIAAGGRLLRGPESGPHEVRAMVSDPDGTWLVLHAPPA